jgi:hypothetical protein
MIQKLMSIDIGVVNFSYCIEERDITKDGCTIESILQNGTITHLENQNITLKSVIDVLNALPISECNGGVIIENQLRANLKCVKMQQHIATYFMIVHPKIKVIPFSSKHKTHVFTDEKMTKYQRKKYTVVKALELLSLRKDDAMIKTINSVKKKDDMADVIMQLQAYKIINLKTKPKRLLIGQKVV